jgi:hypothetical protein
MINVVEIFKEIAKSTGKSIEIILVGAQALPYYGVEARATMDIDAEIVRGDLELRRGTEQDLEDCLNVALANQLSVEELDRYFENAISNSIKDTAIFNFRLIYNHFRQALMELLSQKSERTPDSTQS